MSGFLVAVLYTFLILRMPLSENRLPTFPGHGLTAIEMRRPLLFERVAAFLCVLGGEANRLQIALVLNRPFRAEALFAATLTKIGTSVQEPTGSKRANSTSPSRVGFEIGSTSDQLPGSPVLFVGGAPRIPIIFASPKAALYPAR